MFSSGTAYDAAGPEPPAMDDLRFLYEQACRYVESRLWERLASASLDLDLRVGSWHQVCAQLFSNRPANVFMCSPIAGTCSTFRRRTWPSRRPARPSLGCSTAIDASRT
jgi:hypothetical protein